MGYEEEGALGGAAQGATTGMMLGGPVGAVIGGIIGGIGGLFGGRAKKDEDRMRKQIAQYNATVARQNARTKADAIELAGDRLTKRQRQVAADQIMNVYGRGGRLAGTDLSSIITDRKQMFLDGLQLIADRDSALSMGEQQAQQIMLNYKAQQQIQKAQSRQELYSSVLSSVDKAYTYSKTSVPTG